MSVRLLLAISAIIYPLSATAEAFSHSIPGSSMYPTLIPGDLIGASSYKDGEDIARGDLVTHRQKSDGTEVTYCGASLVCLGNGFSYRMVSST